MATDAALYRLMNWLSPGFPVGAYSYSHGIETAVEEGLIRTADDLAHWVGRILEQGAGRMDGAVFRLAFEAVAGRNPEGFAAAVERGALYRGTAELALESTAQGEAFLSTVEAAWPVPGLQDWQDRLARTGHAPSYPVAVAMVAALAGIDRRAALCAFLTAFAGNLVNAGVRLVPLGQTDGQRVLARLDGPVTAALDKTLGADTSNLIEDFGAAVPMVDWTSAAHETLYTRIFRS